MYVQRFRQSLLPCCDCGRCSTSWHQCLRNPYIAVSQENLLLPIVLISSRSATVPASRPARGVSRSWPAWHDVAASCVLFSICRTSQRFARQNRTGLDRETKRSHLTGFFEKSSGRVKTLVLRLKESHAIWTLSSSSLRRKPRQSTNIWARTTRFWPRSATSATCRPRTARCVPTRISPCPGRSTAPRRKRLTEIAKAVKDADGLILATDPDREGEAISWHVLEVLKQKRALKDKPVSRVVFNAITKQSVLDAMANPRQIDGPLVDAYLARRALDYLVGFTLSPVLWRKLPGARSAGRVQSVALQAGLRPRGRDRALRARGILADRGAAEDAAQRRVRGAPHRLRNARSCRSSTSPTRRRPTTSSPCSKARRSASPRSRRSRPSAIPARPSPPRRCSRRPRPISASRPRAPCRSRSGSMRASMSAARPAA